MSMFKNRFLKSDFSKNLAVMFSGNGVAMLLPFILAPFISRLYTPADFAGYELFVKILTLCAVVSSLRFEMAILLPKSVEESLAIIRLSFKLLFYSCLIAGILFIPFRKEIGILLNNDSIASLMWWLPLGILVTGAMKILSQYLMRQRSFGILSGNKILAAGSNNGMKYLLGLKMPSSLGLVVGHIFGLALPVAALFRRKGMREMVAGLKSNMFPSKSIWKKYRDFPLVNTFHILIEEGQEAILLFLISAYYGEIMLGLFAFAMRYLRVPFQVFGTSLSSVLHEQFARNLNNGINIRPGLIKIVLVLAAVCFVPLVVLHLYGEPLFGFVFGDQWVTAGTYAEYLAPWLFLYFIESPISMVPLIVERQRAFFAIDTTGHVLTLVVVAYLSMQNVPFEYVLMAFTTIQSVLLLVLIIWFIYIAGASKGYGRNQNKMT